MPRAEGTHRRGSQTDGPAALLPPVDFVPTAIAWGVWAAGVLAARNYFRLGKLREGVLALAGSVAVDIASFACLVFASPSHSGVFPPVARVGVLAAIAAIRTLSGIALWQIQARDYRQATAQAHLRRTPYLRSITVAIGLVGCAFTILVVGLWYFGG